MGEEPPVMRTAFSVRMPPELEAQFRAACARVGVRPSDVFRDAAESFVEAHDQAGQETT